MLSVLSSAVVFCLLVAKYAFAMSTGVDKMSGIDKNGLLLDWKRRQIYNSFSVKEKIAIAGVHPSFEKARPWICAKLENDILLARYKVVGRLDYSVYKVVDMCDQKHPEWTMMRFGPENEVSGDDYGTLQRELTIHAKLGRHENTFLFERTISLDYGKYGMRKPIKSFLTTTTFGSMTLDIMRNLMRQLVEAIHHVHSKNVVMADINMNNVLVHSTNPLQIRLTGFRHSYDLDSDIPNNYNCETDEYMTLDKHYRLFWGNRKSDDIWALGILMRRLLVNQDDIYGAIKKFVSDRLYMQPQMTVDDAHLKHFYVLVDQTSSGYGNMPNNLANFFNNGLKLVAGNAVKFAFYESIVDEFPKISELLPGEFTNDENFLDFFKKCLQFDPNLRASIDVLRDHPFLKAEPAENRWVHYGKSWLSRP